MGSMDDTSRFFFLFVLIHIFHYEHDLPLWVTLEIKRKIPNYPFYTLLIKIDYNTKILIAKKLDRK